MIIRGLSFFFGGFPNEAENLTTIDNDNLQISGYIYLYFLLFIVLIYASIGVQSESKIIDNFRKQWSEPQEEGTPFVINNNNIHGDDIFVRARAHW
jgi:hypothetical protein